MKKTVIKLGKVIVFLTCFICVFYGCQRTTKKNTETENKNEKKELNLLNWRFYIGESTIKNFETEFNVRVNINYYASNEECYSKIKNSPGGV